MGLEKRICNSFDDYVGLLYECLFTRIGLQPPFSKFRVDVLNHLKVASSLLHLEAWTYTKVFQFCVEHKSLNYSLKLFLILFYMGCTSKDKHCDKVLISYNLEDPWFDHFTRQ